MKERPACFEPEPSDAVKPAIPWQADPCTHRDNPKLCREIGWVRYEKLEGERDFNDV